HSRVSLTIALKAVEQFGEARGVPQINGVQVVLPVCWLVQALVTLVARKTVVMKRTVAQFVVVDLMVHAVPFEDWPARAVAPLNGGNVGVVARQSQRQHF